MRAFSIGIAVMLVLAIGTGFALDWAQQPTSEQSARLGSVHLAKTAQ